MLLLDTKHIQVSGDQFDLNVVKNLLITIQRLLNVVQIIMINNPNVLNDVQISLNAIQKSLNAYPTQLNDDPTQFNGYLRLSKRCLNLS